MRMIGNNASHVADMLLPYTLLMPTLTDTHKERARVERSAGREELEDHKPRLGGLERRDAGLDGKRLVVLGLGTVAVEGCHEGLALLLVEPPGRAGSAGKDKVEGRAEDDGEEALTGVLAHSLCARWGR
jgi:hypothetical protein